jgi:hypothetical protein
MGDVVEKKVGWGRGGDEDDRNGKHVTFWLLVASLLPPARLAFIKLIKVHLGVSVHGKNKPTTAIICMYVCTLGYVTFNK